MTRSVMVEFPPFKLMITDCGPYKHFKYYDKLYVKYRVSRLPSRRKQGKGNKMHNFISSRLSAVRKLIDFACVYGVVLG